MRLRFFDNRLVTLLPIFVLMPALATAQDHEEKYLNGLRSRRLFALAEKYCEDELAEETQSARRAALVTQLSRTLVEHGKYLPTKERDALWKRADQVLFDGSGKIPEPELKTRIEAQGALNLAHQATFLRWQAQVMPQDTLLKEFALFRIEKAKKALSSAVSRVRDNYAGASFDRTSLRNTLELYQGQAIMDQARLEPDGSADRIELASQAQKIAGQLASTAVTKRTKLEARVLSAECARERGNGRKAITMLDSATDLAVSDSDRDRIVAERVRSLLYEQQPHEATKQLIAYRQKRGSLTGELHLLRMQSLIAMWEIARTAKNEKLGDELIKQMETGDQYAQREVGGFWAFRCKQLLNATRQKNTLGSELAKLKLKAEQDYTAGRTTAAASNFGLAADEAVRKEKFDVAAQLYYQQGSLLVQDKQFESAALAFKRAANADEIEKGSNAHLMYAWSLGRLYQESSTRRRREAYSAALEEHRTLYKAGTTFAEATFMLASLEETRLQNTRAIDFYRQIRIQNQPRYNQASAALARCYTKVLDRIKSMNNPELLAEWQAKAEQDITARVAELPTDSKKADLVQSELVIRGAAILLQGEQPNYARASKLIEWGMAGIGSVEPSKKTAQLTGLAERWRLIAAVASGGSVGADKWTADLQNRTGPELMGLIDSLDGITNDNPQTRLDLSAVRLKVGEAAVARGKELQPADRARLAVWMVGAYLDVGERGSAMRQAEKIIKASRDQTLLSRTSALVQTLNTRGAQTLAQRGWKRVENTSKAGSSTWINARLHVTECTLNLGETEAARKLLRVTKLLYPDLGGPQTKQQFEQLESQLP